ncbi:alkaline phosphatase, tissue-nonspecific isozyme-like [Anopheles maculipalpis]|uniref:alkaline phosphatase, tissue-nonspecific isozyme-like n=1 Tax=Anopheles maculipalpis TaxID=1496333 RepID=UPI002158D12E|nr:alkaline phosphatase, tissue-nonspecific isozyme-like [Anopheles maculipalpis]
MKKYFVYLNTLLVLIVIVSAHRLHHPFALELLDTTVDSLRLQPRAAGVNVTESESVHPPPAATLSEERPTPEATDEHSNEARHRKKRLISAGEYEQTAQYWNIGAQLKLKEHLLKQPNRNIAKNVIFFLGDGMSIPTLAASRMYLGQQQGHTGEESRLSFEEFPDVGLVKTYCVDKQVADSACTATAYLCGVKANYATIGVTAAVNYGNCAASNDPRNQVQSLMAWAQAAGKATGIVTTTRVTHASPAGTYAHTANRDWECDADVVRRGGDAAQCPDIASQLIYGETGKNFRVILGGGRRKFLPKTMKDEEGFRGQRLDGANLISQWYYGKPLGTARYVSNKHELMALNFTEVDYLLGLFSADHMKFHLDARPEMDPTLGDLTYAAIRTLEKYPEGYVLFVEGGKIDLAHHFTKARKSLDETVQLSEAVQVARQLTSPDNTLLVVTADHSHTMTLSGYAARGNDILGLNSQISDGDKKPYTTLTYANGPGGPLPGPKGQRPNITESMIKDREFQFPKVVPMKYETHGGDDVALFACGPWSHLFGGMYEQNVIPHLIGYAACIGNGEHACSTVGGL